MHYNYLIIGGGITGVTAAETIRAKDHYGKIAVISFENNLLYSRVLLPNYIKKRIRREQIFLRGLDDFARFDIDLFLDKEAVFLDSEKREIKLKSGEIYSFDKLLIASGGAPRAMNINGESLGGIFRLQTIEDADNIKEFIPRVKSAAVIGGGFISLEFLEIAHVYKVPTTLISRGKYFFDGALDDAGGQMLSRNFERYGIDLIFDDEVHEFFGSESVTGFYTKRGNSIKAGMVGIGIGLKKNDDFLLGTGISVMPGAGVRVNEFLETAKPGIFAAGDIAEYLDANSGEYHTHGNWTNSFLQGRIAGQNMVDKAMTPFKTVPFYSITNLGLHITFLGETEADEGITTLSRYDQAKLKYERFFMRGDCMVGAIMINMFQDKTILGEIIEKRIPITGFRKNLSDTFFDIKTIVDKR